MGCTENINLTRSKNRFTRPFHRQVRVLQAKNHLNACLHSLYKPFIPFAFFYKFVPLYSLFPPQKTLFIVLSVKQSSSQEKSLSTNLTAITSCILSMASFKLPLVLFLSSLFLQAALAEIVCEELPNDICAFTVSSSGKRCLLETYAKQNGAVEYQCRTSEVVVEKMADYIETDACVKACGVDRNSVGISSDALLEPQFTGKLCSPACYQNCPNIVDLYFNLAAGEGAFLPDLCDAARYNPHRSMIQLMSSGAAPGPVASETASLIAAPAPAPM